MRLLTNITDYDETINIAHSLSGDYNIPVLFHCYWKGSLNEKHLYSILSCYYFNIHNKKHKIILWLEDNTPNQYNIEIEKYAEIKTFSISYERDNSGFINNLNIHNSVPSWYSDVVRYVLLYNYGGVWFDLDCFILRSFDPLFLNYENELCVYQWEYQNYPNGAIYISLAPRSEKMKKNIEFIINRNRGWGFQEAQLTYDCPLDLLVLPCSWFDAGWIQNRFLINVMNPLPFFKKTDREYNFNNFLKGAFCFHWHNRWNILIEDNSIILQLINIIKKDII